MRGTTPYGVRQVVLHFRECIEKALLLSLSAKVCVAILSCFKQNSAQKVVSTFQFTVAGWHRSRITPSRCMELSHLFGGGWGNWLFKCFT
jgi:hypothetical protein